LSSENIDILKKNNVILRAIREYGFWETPQNCRFVGVLQPAFILMDLQRSAIPVDSLNMINGGIYQ
jgi:hypothetical protein